MNEIAKQLHEVDTHSDDISHLGRVQSLSEWTNERNHKYFLESDKDGKAKTATSLFQRSRSSSSRG